MPRHPAAPAVDEERLKNLTGKPEPAKEPVAPPPSPTADEEAARKAANEKLAGKFGK